MKRLLGTSILVPALASLAMAQSPSSNPRPPANPAPKPAMTTLEMRTEAAKSLKQADEALNLVYEKLLSKLDDEHAKKLLRQSERAWLKYRDDSAAFESSFYEGGSIQPQIHTLCLERITKARTIELQRILSEEFDR